MAENFIIPQSWGKEDEIANSINRNSGFITETQIYLIYINLQPAGVRVDLNC